MLSVIMQLLFWSKIVDPVIAEPAEISGSQECNPYIPGGRYGMGIGFGDAHDLLQRFASQTLADCGRP